MVPDGVVVFFPSYDYLSLVLKQWKRPSTYIRILSPFQRLSKTKKVFFESKEVSTTETLLQEYSVAIDSGQGAVLFSVVGGKLSEGINFSDKLGRAVIVVGLPFPNLHSAVWKAKMQHIEQKTYELSSQGNKAILPEQARRAEAKAAAREFYENVCMRAVNQCIGRAIRHANDYAAIVLLDRRYSTERIQGKLPAWIRSSIVPATVAGNTSQINSRLKNFFRDKN